MRVCFSILAYAEGLRKVWSLEIANEAMGLRRLCELCRCKFEIYRTIFLIVHMLDHCVTLEWLLCCRCLLIVKFAYVGDPLGQIDSH